MKYPLHVLAAAAVCSMALVGCGGGGEGDGSDSVGALSAEGRARPLAVAQLPATGILRFTFEADNHDVKIVVGPAPGVVTVEGVIGVPNGTVYTGIKAIEWRSGAGTSRFVFEVNQAEDFDISIDTGAGNAEFDVKWMVPAGSNAAITPSLALRAGAGSKKVQVQLESFGRDVSFDLSTAFGAGNAELKGELQFKQGSVRGAGRLALDFGSGFNKASLMVDSEAQHLDLDIAPRFMQELETKVISDDPSQTAMVRFAPVGLPGGSKIGFEMLSAAPLITLDYDVQGGASLDEVKLGLATLGVATVTSRASMQLAGSNDKLELSYKGLPGTRINLAGVIDLGPGDDEAVLLREGTSSTAPLLNCNAGMDKAPGWPLGRTVDCESL